MDSNILAILTSEDRDEIKQALKDAIINQIQDDFRENVNYLFDVNEIEKMTQEAIDEVKEEIKPMVKEFMFNQVKEKLKL